MKLPKTFQLLGHTWKVRVVPACELEGTDWGHCDQIRKEILILDTSPDNNIATFFHEAVHAALGAMGSPLNNNEEFVETLGGLIHQITTTAK